MQKNNQLHRSYGLATGFLKDIIQRCHQQREKSLRQRKTIVIPALYKDYPYHFRVHCARAHAIRLYDLEQANISFMPIGHAPKFDHAPGNFGGDRFLRRQGTQNWSPKRWFASWGIQIYTGRPSGRNGAEWHDIDFQYNALCAVPDAVLSCIEALVNSAANPLLTLTKSGGLRFSCRIANYLHPNTDEAKQYIRKHTPTAEDPYHREVYLEIRGDESYSRWDGRYEILLGNLLDPPIITKEVIFAPIDALRDALHEPVPPVEDDLKPAPQATPVKLLTPDPVDEQIIAVREGKLSPLAIRRPTPVLQKSELKGSSDPSRQPSNLHVPEHDEKTGWLYAVDDVGTRLSFRRISISKDLLKAWSVDWHGKTLGNFAKALLNALESKNELYENPVGRVRMTVAAFAGQAEILTEQMREENPNQTLWHQLESYFGHYKRDADAPMVWDDDLLQFWLPSASDAAQQFSDDTAKNGTSKPWLSGNRVFQIRTGIYSMHHILNYDNSWDYLRFSKIGKRFFDGIRAEIKKDSNTQHVVICGEMLATWLENTVLKENVYYWSHIKRAVNANALKSEFELADVIWIVGAPYWPPQLMWKQAQILFGGDEEPLSYDVEMNPYRYKDTRIQGLCEQNIVGILTKIIQQVRLDCFSNKTVVLLTGMPPPNITDRPETLLFDWEDFEVAGGLDKLPEVIAERERFETKRDNLTAESDRQTVEDVLGISRSQANRVLMKLRGGKIERVPFYAQIHALLESGEKTTSELIDAIDGHPGAVKNELKRLVDAGEIVKVRRAVYALPSE
ncbi:MAG: hypothetical protein OXN25_00320 [Candidatus Poribacteria bacterium]|nr:hypothetical protein [Candidatus Poribacteria bacterium]